MEQIYSKEQNQCKLIQSKPETVRFLLDYSKSLRIQKFKGLIIEHNMN